jgi:hypothetical protein
LYQSALYKQLLTILLFAAFGTQTLSKLFLVADYYANTETYARQCQNKWRPAMNCNGKCLLMKKIQAAEKKAEENQERKDAGRFDTILSSRSFFSSMADNYGAFISIKKIPAYAVEAPVDQSFAVFRPPQTFPSTPDLI